MDSYIEVEFWPEDLEDLGFSVECITEQAKKTINDVSTTAAFNQMKA